jgi:hypothetical protein
VHTTYMGPRTAFQKQSSSTYQFPHSCISVSSNHQLSASFPVQLLASKRYPWPLQGKIPS